MPNKLLGQHFLNDPSVLAKIVRALDPKRGDVIYEIGPGHGELTRPLAEACLKNGAKLFAIEKDAALARALKEDGKIEGVEIVTGDALELLNGADATKIVGNIPYYLTGHLLRAISELPKKPARCVLMVQKEVALRMAAHPPKMNRLAASVQFWADLKTVGAVSREQFDPPPQVDSVIMAFETKTDVGDAPANKITADRYYAAVRTIFAQPRKTVLNNLAARSKNEGKAELLPTLEKIGVIPNARPQDLSIQDVTAIAQALF